MNLHQKMNLKSALLHGLPFAQKHNMLHAAPVVGHFLRGPPAAPRGVLIAHAVAAAPPSQAQPASRRRERGRAPQNLPSRSRSSITSAELVEASKGAGALSSRFPRIGIGTTRSDGRRRRAAASTARSCTLSLRHHDQTIPERSRPLPSLFPTRKPRTRARSSLAERPNTSRRRSRRGRRHVQLRAWRAAGRLLSLLAHGCETAVRAHSQGARSALVMNWRATDVGVALPNT